MKTFIIIGLICLGFILGVFAGHELGHRCQVEKTPERHQYKMMIIPQD